MELTPEEKQKIYEEEKERLAAQDKIKKEKQQKTSKNVGIGCLSFIGIIILIAIIGNLFGSKNSNVSNNTISLNAAVSFNGEKFFITNKDDFDWIHVKFYIDDIVGGYKTVSYKIDAKSTYSIGAINFAKSDGTRFNPFIKKPQKFYVVATTNEDKTGVYQCAWK
jgi:hypothetical protein